MIMNFHFNGDRVYKRSIWTTVAIGAFFLVIALIRMGILNLGSSSGKNGSSDAFSTAMIESYKGEPIQIVHDDIPFFTEEDRNLTEGLPVWNGYDVFNRITPSMVCLGEKNMPEEFRIIEAGEETDEDTAEEEKDKPAPTGWKQVKYDSLECKWLYLCVYLIPWASEGELAVIQNAITATNSFFTDGMRPCLEEIRDYISQSGNHVLYRATPVFEGINLVASGVLIEAESVEDHGNSFQLCRYIYNVQPGIAINYLSGSSFELGE